MAGLSIRNLHKTYGSTKVLNGINIDVADGEFLILVGPSGCGKSTLLSIIAGLEEASSGEIYIDGHLVNKLSPKDRDIAMVFQSYALYPNMTVRRNIAFGLEMRKVDKKRREEIVQNVASILQIQHLLDRKPSQLSGGQRQRVATGRAIARNPVLFLFDEPLSNLDAKLREELRTEIKQLHSRVKKTTIYVTHDQMEAMTLADRMAVMRAGELQQIGTPQEIYNDPRNLFVAGFIGSPRMNFIPCRIEARNADIGITLTTDCGVYFVAIPAKRDATRLKEHHQIILGMRPEMISHKISSWENEAHSHLIHATVKLCVPTGPDTLVVIQINSKDVICRVHPAEAKQPGEIIELTFNALRGAFFDASSELRIL